MDNTYLGNELSVNKAVAVGVASVEVSNPKFRSSYSIRNVSAAGQVINIVLSNNDPAVVGVGIQLGVGESFIDSDSEGYKCWSGAIRCIASAAAGSVAIMERVEE